MITTDTVLTNREWDQLGLLRASKLAPRPAKLSDTGLSETFVADLIAKHLFDRGTLSLGKLANIIALAGSIVEGVLNFMRTEARVEIRPGQASTDGLAYTLTERGRVAALDAMMRSGYLGPAPVPLRHYAEIARAQTIHRRSVTQDSMRTAFEDVVLDDAMLDRLGPALNSGRAMFLYGAAGTGKTYISQRLCRLFRQPVLIPSPFAPTIQTERVSVMVQTRNFGIDESSIFKNDPARLNARSHSRNHKYGYGSGPKLVPYPAPASAVSAIHPPPSTRVPS